MSLGLSAATVLQTFFVAAFLLILVPLRLPKRNVLVVLVGIMAAICVAAGVFSARFGLVFIMQYGYPLIGLPLYVVCYLFSKAKGSRFVFIMVTISMFHRIICTLLMVVRVQSGGYTPLYFLMNFLMCGLLLYGARHLRTDFHKIVFAYQKAFGCLSVILIILLAFVWIFSPVSEYNQVDNDILLIAALLYLMILMLYFYIGVSFRNFSKRLDAERNALSLGHQMQAAQEHIKLIQLAQERTRQYRHDLRHHILLINEFLDHGKIEELRVYLAQVRKDIDTITPERYCSNEAANLILASFSVQAGQLGIHLEVAAQIPQSLSISDTELCTLLSNALENSVAATARVEDGRAKMIRLSANMLEGKLLLLVENPYTDTVRMENGLPQSDHSGHGFGTKSMEAIAEKYGGLSCFEAQDGMFTVRIVV